MTSLPLRIAFKNLAYRRLRSALAIVAVALGTAVVAATFGTNAALEENLRQRARAMAGSADLVVEALDERGFPQSAVRAIQALPEVTLVAPVVQKRTYFRTAGTRGFVELVGIDPEADPQIRPYQLAAGRSFSSPNEPAVLAGREWAQRNGLHPGDSVELVTEEGFKPFLVAGLLEEVDPAQSGSGGLLRVPLRVAQASFALEDRILSISLKLRDPEQTAAVKRRLEGLLPSRFVARETGQVMAELEASIADFQVALLFFGGVALLAGGFLVFNTLSLTVAERAREIGLMRGLGAGTGLIREVTMVEALLLGAAGALAGVLAGQALAWGLALAIAVTQQVPVAGIPVSLTGLLISLALGLGVTLAAALVPALEAGRVAVAAVLAGRVTARPAERRQALVGLGATLGLAAALLLPVEGELRALKLLGLLALFPLFIYASRILIPILTSAVSLPFSRMSRSIRVLAERNLRREGSRASSTAAGFVISLSLVVALSNSSASFTTAGDDWARSLFPGQFTAVSPVEQPLELLTAFEEVQGVEQVSAVSTLPVLWNNLRLSAAGVEPSHYFQAFQFREGERTSAFRELRRGGALLVPARLAQERNIRPGDRLLLRAGGREAGFSVAGVITHSLPTADNYGALILASQDVQTLFGISSFRFLTVSAAPDADLAAVQQELGQVAESLGLELTTVGELRRAVAQGVGALIGLLTGLAVTGLLVGFLSVVNTMVVSVAQRSREIAILRAGGLTGGQVQRLFVMEAGILGALGSLFGILLGAFLTWVLVDLARTGDFDPQFAFSAPGALLVLAVGTGSAALAAFYPARAAGATNIVKALRAS